MDQASLFESGFAGAPAQHTLFENGRMQDTSRSRLPDPADIRRKLTAVLDRARHAERMPWNGRDARMWQTVFPQMANWLPEEEAVQLRLEFAREVERLKSVA